MKRLFLLMTIAILTCTAFAQTKISGTVVDKNNQPMMGVQVVSEVGGTAVTTDFDGRFEIDVAIGSNLTFSLLGIKSVTKPAADNMVVVMGDGNDRVGRFQGMFDLNSNFTSTHAGGGMDFIFGYRVKQYYHVGVGLGAHSLIGKGYVDDEKTKKVNDYNVAATIYLNNIFYIPTKGKVSPMFDLGIGGNVGWLGIGQSYKETIFGLYAKAGFGFDVSMFRMSAGYEFLGTHTGYVRIGLNF